MTFDSNMQLVEQIATPELYDITAGGYVWRVTSYKTDLTFLSNLYKAGAIRRSSFTVDQQLGSARVSITVPFTDPLKKYIGVVPLPSTRVAIYRAIANSLGDYALVFDGMIQRVGISDKVISAECSPSGKLAARLPHIVYQSYCNWTVFDCNCGLDINDWGVAAEVTVSGATLISATFAAYADTYFTQGRVYFDGDWRFVTSHVGNTLTLQIPFGSDLTSGLSVTAYPGCDGSPSTCKTKFDNFATRHVSMPYIPSHHPIVWGFK